METKNDLFRAATLARSHIELYLTFRQARDLERAAEIIEDCLQAHSREEAVK